MLMTMLIISLFNHGLYYLYTNTPIFSDLAEYMKPKGYEDGLCERWKHDLYQPFFGCPICFSSVYGSIVFIIVAPYFDAFDLRLYPVVLIGSVFISQLLLYIKEKLQ